MFGFLTKAFKSRVETNLLKLKILDEIGACNLYVISGIGNDSAHLGILSVNNLLFNIWGSLNSSTPLLWK